MKLTCILVKSRHPKLRIPLLAIVALGTSIPMSELHAAPISYMTQNRDVAFMRSILAIDDQQKEILNTYDLFDPSLGKLREVKLTFSAWVSNEVIEVVGPCPLDECHYYWSAEEGYILDIISFPDSYWESGDWKEARYRGSGTLKQGESISISLTDGYEINEEFWMPDALLGDFIGTTGSITTRIYHNIGTNQPSGYNYPIVDRRMTSSYTGQMSLTYGFRRVPDSGSSLMFLGMAIPGLIGLRVASKRKSASQ